ncbi:MAG TPA: tRNA uridine-5-carboxymethylaminomethyl(34) synthesis GTPase MnmE [Verrucomicrobiae bacterium]|nr:tRNA uridine-5-carboxymethylaminomethyl(34) synthesis GTPase MnmE [Verrucomicrobiae bacterium]
MDDTIAAISTPIGEGGIAIIRISGPRAIDVADRIFQSRHARVSEFPTHTLHFGTIGINGEVVDQVMLAVMRAPRTYTKEDTVELNCHGGILTARKILALCLDHGARLAEPGEFTKRAFLNGRLDLTQAEAVMDLIRAKSDRAHTAAVHELEGHLSAKIDAARDKLLTVLAHIEAHIDFPEDDIGPEVRADLMRNTEEVVAVVRTLLATAREGRILRDGISVAIVGRPNVGKSSLLNALVGHDRAIVTPVPGTTRDTVDETVSIDGIPFRFTDTAGIRRGRATAERLGVKRSRKTLDASEIALTVCDLSQAFTAADAEVIGAVGTKRSILVLNKSDLPPRLRLPAEIAKGLDSIRVSATRGDGLDNLRAKLVALAYSGTVGTAAVDVAINERQRNLLGAAMKYLTGGCDSLKKAEPLEIVAQHVRAGLNSLGEIVGKTSTEDILDRIFSAFCIGK